MQPPTVIFAGGGTGGHLYPGLAVARALCDREPSARALFLTTDRPLDRDILRSHAMEQVVQPVRPVPSRPWRLIAFWRAWRASGAIARSVMRERRVAAVLGLGGYAAGPPVVAAHRAGVPAAILNPDVIPGRANRFLASRTDRVFAQWDATVARLPGARVEVVGCPIRPAFRALAAKSDARDVGRAHFSMPAEGRLLLVTGASQGARTVNDAMVRVWPVVARRHHDWRLLHLTGAGDLQRVQSAYNAAGAPADRTTAIDFTEHMAEAIAAADVVVSRAGASTLAELTTLGRASVLLPYPFHRDRHQHANAEQLAAAGAAAVVEDARDAQQTGPQLEAALEGVIEADRYQQMSDAARRQGLPDAAHRVAAWLAESF